MEKEILTQLTTLGHAQRMAVFRLLVRRFPDSVPAGEIGDALGIKPSTLSVYLSALKSADLVGQQRQGTSLQYQARIQTIHTVTDFLLTDCCKGRPSMCSQTSDTTKSRTGKLNVLFICSANSARSIFAEAILRQVGGDQFSVYSAGIRPYTGTESGLNPIAVQMLADKGYDTSLLKSQSITEFQSPEAPVMDFVFTVCDESANEECPPWHGQPISAHWGLPDPVKAEGTDAQKQLAFQNTYGALRNRIVAFSALPFETLDRASLQNRVDALSAGQEENA